MQVFPLRVDLHLGYPGRNEHNAPVLRMAFDVLGLDFKLSQRRADAVRGYLAAAGVAPARMKTVALGKSKPEVKAENIEGHAQNRRVVFVPAGVTEMQVNPQREDLQLKGDPAARKPAQGGAKSGK